MKLRLGARVATIRRATRSPRWWHARPAPMVGRLTDAFAALFALYHTLSALTGDRLWPSALVHGLAVPASLFALILAGCCLWWRRISGIVLLGAGTWTLVLLSAGGPLRPAPVTSGPGFVAMTYNLHYGRIPPARLTAALATSGADIIGLQELDEAQATAIARDLRDSYPHQALFPGGIAGTGIVSRYPIHEAQQLELYPERPDLLALIEVDGHQITVVVGHPLPPRLYRYAFDTYAATDAQIEALDRLASASAPSLLLADLNLTPLHAQYAELRASGLVDSFAEAGTGLGLTLPRRAGAIPMPPFVRIDYVWHTPDLGASDAWVGSDAGSDHLPVLVRLHWRASSNDSLRCAGNITRPRPWLDGLFIRRDESCGALRISVRG
jgi:vancomycin resistance protein VanJ